MNFERRLTGLRETMARDGLGLVVYGAGPQLRYLIGLPFDWRARQVGGGADAHVFVPAEGAPVLVLAGDWADGAGRTSIADVRVCEDAAEGLSAVRAVLADRGAGGAKVALGPRVAEAVALQIRAVAGAAPVVDAADLLDEQRRIKEPQELQRLRDVARLTGEVMAAVVPFIREGVTQWDLEAELALQGRRMGADGVSFPPAAKFVKSGSAPTDDPFVYPVDEGLSAGTSIAFDFGFVMDGYCSDFGRSFYFGGADEHVRGAYAALQAAVVETVSQIRPGRTRGCELFPRVEATLDRLGYGDYLRARLPGGVLGHQIGLDVHENPWLRPDCQTVLQPNMVMALEPKLWRTGEYYLRVEDIVLVGADGAEFLTRFDRDLFEL